MEEQTLNATQAVSQNSNHASEEQLDFASVLNNITIVAF